LKVTEIVFHDSGCATLVVEMPDTGSFTTEGRAHIPRILFKLLPQMASQHCFNDGGHSFGREAQATEIPHLFEHLIMEIQNQVRRGVGAPLSGETHWNWTVDPRGRFYVTVDYDNEVVALGAIRLAECLISALDRRDITRIDMAREIGRLREIAKLSRRLSAPHSPHRHGALRYETPPEEASPGETSSTENSQSNAPPASPEKDADSAALANV